METAGATRDDEIAAVRVVEVDGDGHLDVVMVQNRSLAWYRGRGDGAFMPGGIHTFEEEIASLEVQDFDGDGRAEAVISVPERLDLLYLDEKDGVQVRGPRFAGRFTSRTAA